MTDKLIERLPDDLVTITLEDGRTHDYVPLSALQHAQKEIERLTDVIIDDAQAIGRSAEACMGMMNQRDEAITRAEAAERERDELRRALRPFVVYTHESFFEGDGAYTLKKVKPVIVGGGWYCAEDLRRARASLNQEGS